MSAVLTPTRRPLLARACNFALAHYLRMLIRAAEKDAAYHESWAPKQARVDQAHAAALRARLILTGYCFK